MKRSGKGRVWKPVYREEIPADALERLEREFERTPLPSAEIFVGKTGYLMFETKDGQRFYGVSEGENEDRR